MGLPDISTPPRPVRDRYRTLRVSSSRQRIDSDTVNQAELRGNKGHDPAMNRVAIRSLRIATDRVVPIRPQDGRGLRLAGEERGEVAGRGRSLPWLHRAARASDAGWRWRGSGVGVRLRFDASAADRPLADCHRGCTPETCHWTCPDCAHGCATAPPRLTSQAPRPTPVLPCSLRSRLQIESDRSRNVRARTDNEPDNDHTNTPRTTQIGRLFLLSFVGFGRHPPRGETCGRRLEPVAGKARRVHGEPMSLHAS